MLFGQLRVAAFRELGRKDIGRQVVERNFASVIDGLYRRVHLKSPDLAVEIHVPNWLFQALGLTAGDVRLAGGQLTMTPTGASLAVHSVESTDDGEILVIGSCRYLARDRVVDLGSLLSSPALWRATSSRKRRKR